MSTELKVSGIVNESIVDGPGIRMVVFTQGCKHNCPGCHNPETHSFEGGKMISIDSIVEKARKNPLLDGLTFSGGEPFEQAEALAELAKRLKQLGLTIMTYTGYTYEYLVRHSESRLEWAMLLNETDILVDGRFELEKRNILLKFRGSENQRMIDVKMSRENNEVVLAEV